jgi:hypothetical protein
MPGLTPDSIFAGEFIMPRFRYSWILAGSVLLLFGCQQEKHNAAAKTRPQGTIQIEQVKEAQIVLNKLGQRAWVYRHKGGYLTTELTIYHRPQGKDKELESVFHDVNQGSSWNLGNDSAEEVEGYIIVTAPRSALRGGEIVHYLSSLTGSSVRRGKLKDLYPDGTNGPEGIGQTGDGSGVASLELKPGETKHLVGHDIHYSFGDLPIPIKEQEMVRYVLTVTALNDGERPQRGDSSITE